MADAHSKAAMREYMKKHPGVFYHEELQKYPLLLDVVDRKPLTLYADRVGGESELDRRLLDEN
jgi:hypothetical protein